MVPQTVSDISGQNHKLARFLFLLVFVGWFCSVKITPMMRLKFATASPQSALSATKDVLAATEVKSSVKFPLVQKNGTLSTGGDENLTALNMAKASPFIHSTFIFSWDKSRARKVFFFLSASILQKGLFLGLIGDIPDAGPWPPQWPGSLPEPEFWPAWPPDHPAARSQPCLLCDYHTITTFALPILAYSHLYHIYHIMFNYLFLSYYLILGG